MKYLTVPILTFFVTCLLMYWSVDSHAQMSPVGHWYTVDDKTQELKSEIRIVDINGVLSGRIEKLLRKGAKLDAICNECKDERKGKPLIGLDIIQGVRKAADQEIWEGGEILDPESGKSYTLKLIPIEGGKKMEVRGYIAFFRRTQIWIRAASP